MDRCIMGIGNRLQDLGRFLDECERRGEAVDDVDVAAITGVEADRLTADLEVTLSIDTTADRTALRDPQVGPDGTVRFALPSTAGLMPAADHDVAARPTGADLDVDGTVTVTFAATVPADEARADGTGPDVEADAGAEIDGDADAEPSTATSTGNDHPTPSDARTEPDSRETTAAFTSDRDVPPFKDPDLLAEVYEACETFAEMAAALEMDVTGETVRRYMIDYDIHEPNTYRTGNTTDDADDRQDDPESSIDPSTPTDRPAAKPDGPAAKPESEGPASKPDRPASETESRDAGHPAPSPDGTDVDQPVVLSDGIGLPEDVTVDALIETVMQSNTIYEVKRDVDVDREDALELLKELNLLEFVVGQLATEGERETTHEDIIACLRESPAAR
ncbi:hypothetical protein SAMN05192561_10837 [Halopenitus malekzadehii]|uniref:Uncharacterized protein n=1 Tax=Halopenitus malekzadehii TaxID=1267564 RepID=A0A1H6J5Z6_9EURY|nr:hypothetical protein [Halopenitus malekzadehii]SEH57095.1 hypothetical protein SAMN05192561_10837 [Halopenitus malekzadehii]